MTRLSAQTLLALTLIGTVCQATNPAIGLIVTKGDFQADHSRIRGNSTLFDGNTIETDKAPSQLQLNNGVQMRLAVQSRAKVYLGRTILEKGAGQLDASGSYEMEARTLRITGAAPGSIARVQLAGTSKVIVSAMAGAVRVTNAKGVLLANMAPGNELSFDPQAGASAPTQLTGCLLKRGGKYIVVDKTTNVTMEVQGEGLEMQLGNHVEVTGAADGQVLKVTDLKVIVKGGCASVAKKVGAAGAAGTAAGAGAGAAAGGLSTAATVAIIGGVAVAGSLGGLAAAGSFSGTSAPAPASR